MPLELRQAIQHVRVAGGVAAELLQRLAGLVRTSRQRVETRQGQASVGARGVQLSRLEQLLLRLRIAAGLQIGESEILVAERIIGSENSELLEGGLCLRQLVSLEVAEPHHSGGVKLFRGHPLRFARRS